MSQYSEKDFFERILWHECMSVYNYNQKLFAKRLGISPAYLNDILKGRRKLSDKFLKRLGYERICYIRKPTNSIKG